MNPEWSMKFPDITPAILLLAFLTSACNKVPDQPSLPTVNKVTEDRPTVTKDIMDYTYAEKTEFIEKMRIQAAEIHADMDQLAAKIAKADAQAKADAEPKFQALRDKAAQFDKRLEEARESTEASWNDVKTGFSQGYQDLKEGFRQARQWASDKIAP